MELKFVVPNMEKRSAIWNLAARWSRGAGIPSGTVAASW